MKRYILFFCLSTLICLNGCFQDDTTLATDQCAGIEGHFDDCIRTAVGVDGRGCGICGR